MTTSQNYLPAIPSLVSNWATVTRNHPGLTLRSRWSQEKFSVMLTPLLQIQSAIRTIVQKKFQDITDHQMMLTLYYIIYYWLYTSVFHTISVSFTPFSRGEIIPQMTTEKAALRHAATASHVLCTTCATQHARSGRLWAGGNSAPQRWEKEVFPALRLADLSIGWFQIVYFLFVTWNSYLQYRKDGGWGWRNIIPVSI